MPTNPNPKTQPVEVEVDGLSDGQKLAIKLGLMAAVAVTSIVGSNLANRAIEKKFGDK